jgi:hypothetical protein
MRFAELARIVGSCGFGCCSCFASVGPSIGMAGGSPTVGWEVSAAMTSVGKSFALDSEADLAARAKEGDYNFKRRTYLLWNPQIGTVFGDTSQRFFFSGMGGSVGMRWDAVAGANRTQFGALGGAFLGTGMAAGVGGGCATSATPYVSLAVGFRGSEFYVMPKVGVAAVPKFCLEWGGEDENL